MELTSREFSELFLEDGPGLDIPYHHLEVGQKLGSGGFKDCFIGFYKGVRYTRLRRLYLFVLTVFCWRTCLHVSLGSSGYWGTKVGAVQQDGLGWSEEWNPGVKVRTIWMGNLGCNWHSVPFQGNCDMKMWSNSLVYAQTLNIYV
jgi:hypothetical protein